MEKRNFGTLVQERLLCKPPNTICRSRKLVGHREIMERGNRSDESHVEGKRNFGAFHGEAVIAVWNKKGGLDIAEYIQTTPATMTIKSCWR